MPKLLTFDKLLIIVNYLCVCNLCVCVFVYSLMPKLLTFDKLLTFTASHLNNESYCLRQFSRR